MGYVLALDGGGTKVDCLLGDEFGSIVTSCRTGPATQFYHSKEECRTSIATAIQTVLELSGASFKDIKRVYHAMPMDPTLSNQLVRDCVSEHVQVAAFTEFAFSLYGAIQSEAGALALSGTGSFAALRFAGKNEFSPSALSANCQEIYGTADITVGGWGNFAGDEGSAYDIGTNCLRLAAQMTDGRIDATKLPQAICRFFGFPTIRATIIELHRLSEGHRRTTIASLCSLVGQRANSGDGECLMIIRRAAQKLAHQVLATIRQANVPHGFPVTVSGGAWRSTPWLFYTFAEEIRKFHPHLSVRVPQYEPVAGGLLLALRDIASPTSTENLTSVLKDYTFSPDVFTVP